jgi:excisionase family DNA binding protein
MKQHRLDTVETLAARFGLPRRTILREVMNCRLPYVSIAGKWRFRERDIELWLDRCGSVPNLVLLQGGRARELGAAEPLRAQPHL